MGLKHISKNFAGSNFSNFQGTFINYGVMNIANSSTGSNTGNITYAKQQSPSSHAEAVGHYTELTSSSRVSSTTGKYISYPGVNKILQGSASTSTSAELEAEIALVSIATHPPMKVYFNLT